MFSSSDIYYLHTDHLNTTRAITDSGQNVVWRWDSDPFGASTPTSNGFVFNQRLPGQYYDEESGLHYNYFRDYDSSTGRFVQSDPIGLIGGINLHSNNNTVGFVDFFGLSQRDVREILDRIDTSIDDMTERGERFPDPGKNNRCRSMPSVWGIIYDCGDDTDKLKDCGEQTETVVDDIQNGEYDDNWWCGMDAGVGHAWGFCASSNQEDPIIWFDPRSDQVQQNSPCSTCKPWYGDPVYGEEYIRKNRYQRTRGLGK